MGWGTLQTRKPRRVTGHEDTRPRREQLTCTQSFSAVLACVPSLEVVTLQDRITPIFKGTANICPENS